jgi:transposase
MSETRKKYTKEFKIEAVRLYETSSKNGREIERDLGIGKGVLYRWKREMQDENLRAFPGHGNPRDEELYRLRKELAEITEERDILRKAVAIFSKPKK